VQEHVNLEDTEEHDAPPSPNRQIPPFAGNSSLEAVKTPTHTEVSSLQEASTKNSGQGEKIRWSS